jgi:hypothetical protein
VQSGERVVIGDQSQYRSGELVKPVPMANSKAE